MCVTISITNHVDNNDFLPTDFEPAYNVEIPFVQEASFYCLEEEKVEIVITSVILNNSGSPIDVWFTHPSCVIVEDLRATLSKPTINLQTSIMSDFLGQITGEKSAISISELPSYKYSDAAIHAQLTSLPKISNHINLKKDAPYTCIGFGPLNNDGINTAHLLRFGITIAGNTFSRLIRKINGTEQYLYGINGPGIVLEDLWYLFIPSTPEHIRKPYEDFFNNLINERHVAIKKYQILTFDRIVDTRSVRYNRGLAEVSCLLDNHSFPQTNLGEFLVNAWESNSERFIILRGSTNVKKKLRTNINETAFTENHITI